MKTIALAGTFDSKGKEYLYVKELIRSLGFNTFTIHTGVFKPAFEPDVSNAEVAAAADEDIQDIATKRDRAKANSIITFSFGRVNVFLFYKIVSLLYYQ